MSKLRLLVVASLCKGGGRYRTLSGLQWMAKQDIDVGLFLTPTAVDGLAVQELKNEIKALVRSGVKIVGYATSAANLGSRLNFIGRYFLHKKACFRSSGKTYLVVSYDETLDAIKLALDLSEQFKVRTGVLLQGPILPMMKKERKQRVIQAIMMWEKNLEGFTRSIYHIAREKIIWRYSEHLLKKIFRKKACVLAVSRAIPEDMDEPWSSYISYLDPGVALSNRDLELINKIKSRTREKKNIIIFGGRLIPEKGLVETFIAFKHIVKRNPNLKLIVPGGDIGYKLGLRIRRFLKRLEIDDKVFLLGFLPRNRWRRLVAEARLMLYPSHMDAFPYAVLESITLGTPIVAYDIPPMKLYYNGVDGVELVEEGDIAKLAVKAIEVLERRGPIEPQLPRLPTWDEIMKKELEFWYRCAELS